MARSNSPKPADGSAVSPAAPGSRVETPLGTRDDEARASIDSTRSLEETKPVEDLAHVDVTDQKPMGDTNRGNAEADQTLPQNLPEGPPPGIVISEHQLDTSEDSPRPSLSTRPSQDLHSSLRTDQVGLMDTSDDIQTVAEVQLTDGHTAALNSLQSQHEEAERMWKEELQTYTERIDAMQAKLLYLTKEAFANAKLASSDAPVGSLEKKILERDERIALLMEEGQKLSKTEFNHMNTIKRMRTQAAESQKTQKSLRAQIEKAERDKLIATELARRAETATKRTEEQAASISRSEKELSAVTRERNALNATVADIKAQLARAMSRAEAAESKSQTDALDRERSQVAELKDDLSSQKIEAELRENKLRRELKDTKESLEREKGVSQALETQLRGEQSVLERKLESLRSQAEEVTSTGDSQAKLLRQIETLQTQYAVASENWQGIESSLLTRLSSVEKERDSVVAREEDFRRKVRDAALKAKRFEADLEKSRDKVDDLERAISEQQSETSKLIRKLQHSADEVSDLRKDFEKQLQAQEVAFSQRLEEEKNKMREQYAAFQNMPAPSPTLPLFRKSSALDLTHFGSLASPSSTIQSRRSSFMRGGQIPELGTPPRQNSLTSLPLRPSTNHSYTSHPFETPSIHSFEKEPDFNSPTTTTSHSGAMANGVNDLISVSTVGAGPSVALVERMSANVRRLESERAASKDEMTRLTSQRDEARQEVVSLMKEVEEKRGVEERVTALEKERSELEERYQTTLEMLGEKSELVEELRLDVEEVKRIYRELVESTMK